MSDFALPDGREITFDIDKITRREYLKLFDNEQPEEEAYKTLAKACELTADEIGELGQLTWRRFMKAFWQRAGEPLADPND